MSGIFAIVAKFGIAAIPLIFSDFGLFAALFAFFAAVPLGHMTLGVLLLIVGGLAPKLPSDGKQSVSIGMPAAHLSVSGSVRTVLMGVGALIIVFSFYEALSAPKTLPAPRCATGAHYEIHDNACVSDASPTPTVPTVRPSPPATTVAVPQPQICNFGEQWDVSRAKCVRLCLDGRYDDVSGLCVAYAPIEPKVLPWRLCGAGRSYDLATNSCTSDATQTAPAATRPSPTETAVALPQPERCPQGQNWDISKSSCVKFCFGGTYVQSLGKCVTWLDDVGATPLPTAHPIPLGTAVARPAQTRCTLGQKWDVLKSKCVNFCLDGSYDYALGRCKTRMEDLAATLCAPGQHYDDSAKTCVPDARPAPQPSASPGPGAKDLALCDPPEEWDFALSKCRKTCLLGKYDDASGRCQILSNADCSPPKKFYQGLGLCL